MLLESSYLFNLNGTSDPPYLATVREALFRGGWASLESICEEKTMNMRRRALDTGAAVVLLLAVGTLLPTPTQAQQVDWARESLTQFVRVHMALNEARDEFHGKVGRIHDENGRALARAELVAEAAQILEEQDMTREQYDEITLSISLDGKLRTLFEEIAAELTEEGGLR